MTVCQQIKDVIVTSGKLPEEKVVVVYAGTDVTMFDPAKQDARAFRREKGIAEDRFVIAQVGVRDWKGWKELIDSVSDVAPRHPNVHLLLIGCRGEDEKREVLEYARSMGSSVPRLLGSSGGGDRGTEEPSNRATTQFVTAIEYRTDMPNVFASCDLIVDASWAGTGITGTIREGMAMQKPVIATDAGGNRELVESREVGWLIPMRDRVALTKALLEVIEDRERAERVGRAAREHVVNGFSKELRITRLENLYAEILRSADRSPRRSAE